MLFRHLHVPYLRRISAYFASLPPSDRLIAAVLGFLVLATSMVAAYTLERRILVEQPAYGGSLREGIVGSPTFINPLLAVSDADRDLTTLTYAGLTAEGAHGDVVPALAESYSISPDGRTYTFILRKGAQFSDGSPVTADDVLFTVTKAQDPTLKSPELANWANIRVDALDARTVRFTLPKPYAPFLEDTTLGIMPAHLWKNVSNAKFAFSPLNQKPVGAGPFTVAHVGHDKDGLISKVDLAANNRYVLGRPYLDTIHITFFGQEGDLLAALKNGHVESAYGIAKAGALKAPYSRVIAAFFNPTANPLFQHAEVRKALSIAIDRTHITQDVFAGYAVPIGGPVPSGAGIVQAPLPDVATRMDTARVLLTKGGWKFDDSSKTWKNAKTKETLTLTIRTSNVPELKTLAQAVQADWQTLGVPTSVEYYEPTDLTQHVIRTRSYDVLLFGMVVGRDHDLYGFWNSSEKADPGLNIALYTNKAVDQLLEKARSEGSASARRQELATIETLVAADYPAAFIESPDFVYVVPKDLHGVSLMQIAAPSDRFASVASWYRRTEFVWPFLARSSS